MFPNAATQFFQTRTAGPKDIQKVASETKPGTGPAPLGDATGHAMPAESRTYIITVGGEEHTVSVAAAP
jgi:hypothetical protein